MPEGSGLKAGEQDHFTDGRVTWAAKMLAGLAGKTILELGPYEAYNTRQFETMGAASVVAIENNRDNFLKCLIIKNIVGLRSVFLHGDMLEYLDGTHARYDLCWASGVLYHVTDPIRLLEGITRVAKTVFVWTHYVHPARWSDPTASTFFDPSKRKAISYEGRLITLHHRNYNQPVGSHFGGGRESYSYWMEYEDIVHVLAARGFRRIEMGIDNPRHPSGAACFFIAHTD